MQNKSISETEKDTLKILLFGNQTPENTERKTLIKNENIVLKNTV